MKNADTQKNASALDSAEYTRFIKRLTQRQHRVIAALLNGPRSREQIDRIAGASNGPEVIRQLRESGFTIVCEMVKHTDRDGKPGKHGIYHFTANDRQKALDYLSGTERREPNKTRQFLPCTDGRAIA